MADKKYILIAEDSRTIRDQLVYFLKLPEYDILAAEDGRKALDLYDQHAADILLVMSDIHMPEIQGLELARILREERKFQGPLIILTQEGDNGLIRQAKSIGVNGWLIKPFKGEELLQIIKRMLKIA